MINLAELIPVVVDTLLKLYVDLAKNGKVTKDEMDQLKDRIAEVSARFQDIEPFTTDGD